MRDSLGPCGYAARVLRGRHLGSFVWLTALGVGCGASSSPPVESAVDVSGGTTGPLAAVADPLFFVRDASRHPSLPTQALGVAITDVEGDDDLDIAFANGEAGLAYLRNDGTGHFTDQTGPSGLESVSSRGATGVVFVDVDGDGAIDLFVTRRYNTNMVFKGDGAGRFESVGEAMGLTTKAVHEGASFSDLDRDGDLDFYVAVSRDPARDADKWEEGENGAPNFAYRNDGDTFVDWTDYTGLAGNPTGESFGSAIFDVDGDLWPDLFVVHDFRPDEFYRNVGGGRFVLTPEWVEDVGTGLMGLDVADIDGDGLLDIYSTNWGFDHVKLQQPPGSWKRFVDKSKELFGNNADPSGGITGWGCALTDVDNDTDPDVVYTAAFADSADEIRDGRMVLIENRGLGALAGNFIDRSDSAGDAFRAKVHGYGLSTGDLDGDGDVDVVVGSQDLVPPSGERPSGLLPEALMLWNVSGRAAANRSLQLELSDPSSKNRFGVGAIVRVKVNGRVQTRVVLAGSSYLSSIGPRLHFGLGTASVAESVEVLWPDGAKNAGANVPAGFHRIVRP